MSVAMNIASLLTNSARVYPDRLAVAQGRTEWRYGEFDRRVAQLAGGLLRLGLRTGQTVAVLMHNRPEMLESIMACFRAGLLVVPINFRLHPAEFAYIINHSAAEAVIISGHFQNAVLRIRPELSSVKHLVCVGECTSGFIGYGELLDSEKQGVEDVDCEPDQPAWLFYTSGTTGKPKGAMISHRNLMAMTLAYFADYGPLGHEDTILHAAPLSHGSGLYSLPNLAKGAANIILDSKSFDTELVFSTIQSRRVTNMFAAPPMVMRMIESPLIEKYDLSSLHSLIYGGGPMLVPDLVAAQKALGPCLKQLYGMGETPMTITYLPEKDHIIEGPPEKLKRLASAGIPRTGVEVRVVDANDMFLPAGEVGEVVVRSEVVVKGYWRDPNATETLLRGGWLHTGDLGRFDADGYLYLLDRSKDMIISGGENIYPREVEEVIIGHPAVREVAVIGVPDLKWGESIKAVVALKANCSATEDEIVEFCKAALSSYKKPRSVDFVDDLPKNNYGKIVKRDLRAQYWTDQKRNI